MRLDAKRRRAIYDRTSGFCHLCWKKLSLRNYNTQGARGAWHVDHSVPQAKGGTHRLNNLFAACIDCNNQKAIRSSRAFRRNNGLTKAPMSLNARKAAKQDNAVLGLVLGAALGSVAGPWGAAVGAGLASRWAYSQNPDRS